MEVEIDIKLVDYVNGRPNEFIFKFDVFDPDTGKWIHGGAESFLNEAGQTFSRFDHAAMATKIQQMNAR